MNFNFKQSLLNFRRGYGNKGKTDVENDTNNGKKNMKTSDSDTNNITYRQQSWPSFRRKDKTKDKRISLCHDRNDGKIFDGASKRRETLSPGNNDLIEIMVYFTRNKIIFLTVVFCGVYTCDKCNGNVVVLFVL